MWSLLWDLGGSDLASLAKGAALGLVAALLLVFICRKLGLFVRHSQARRMLVKLYHVYIPVVFAGVGAVWFICADLQRQAVFMYDSVRPQVTALSVQATENLWTAVRGIPPDADGNISIKDGVIGVVQKYVEQKFLETLEQRPGLPLLVRDAVLKPGDGLSAAVVNLFEERLVEGAAGQAAVNPATLRAIWDRNIMQGVRAGMVTDLIALWINRTFIAMETKARTIGLLLLLPVMVETNFALLANRRHRKRAAAAAAAGVKGPV